MNKKISMLILFVGILFSSNAQYFDLTTGTSAIGTTDPIWQIQTPGGGGYGPVNVTTGAIEFPWGLIQPNTYAQDNCGRWLSPWTNAANNIVNIPNISGTYTYRMTFIIDECVQNPTAALNLSFMAADNTLSAIRVNGNAQTLPGVISFGTPSSMTSSPAVVNGLNTVEVDVFNSSSFTALQLCGGITVTGVSVAPTNLDCCEALSGEVLSWSPVAGAIGYEVVISYNDPDCCETTDLPYENIYSVTGNSFVLPSPTTCHSWRVRAVFPNNCYSDFSAKQCGCFPIKGKCDAPSHLNCDTQQNSYYLSWGAVAGITNYQIEINYNDPACCETTDLPYSNLFSTASNYMIIPDISKCFSWRVRSICKDGTFSAWSVTKCSCGLGNKTDSNETSRTIKGQEVEVRMEPNPAEEFITINVINPTESLVANNCKLIIHDLSGSVVYESAINVNEAKRVDVTAFKPGMYICNVSVDGKVLSTDKLIIK